jgi:drug/metabolite transporter (DMT)-like permease
MRSNRPNFQTVLSGPVFVSTRRGIPFLPGLLLIVLGVVVLLAPRLVLGAIAMCLLALGGLFCYVAYKIISLRKQLNTLAKNFEGSMYGSMKGSGLGSSPYSDKPDIDITDFENSKKIVYH